MIILLYHNVVRHRPSAFNMLSRPGWHAVGDFDEEIRSIAERFDIVPLDDIANAVRDGRSISRACAITFDDGYAGAYEYAVPILEKYRATATFFVITQQLCDTGPPTYDYFDRLEAAVYLTEAKAIDLSEEGLGAHELTCDECKLAFLRGLRRSIDSLSWDEQVRANQRFSEQLAVPEDRLLEYLSHEVFQPMAWSDVEELRRAGHAIGSHTRTHRVLSQLGAQDLAWELAGSRDDLHSHGADGALALAYPLGQAQHYSGEVIAATRSAGYAYAVSARPGINDTTTGPFELRRSTFRDVKKLRKVLG
jgi:peptidoglycan/xylan/chitin deacetylase (PgdA/CDA1 family)